MAVTSLSSVYSLLHGLSLNIVRITVSTIEGTGRSTEGPLRLFRSDQITQTHTGTICSETELILHKYNEFYTKRAEQSPCGFSANG